MPSHLAIFINVDGNLELLWSGFDEGVDFDRAVDLCRTRLWVEGDVKGGAAVRFVEYSYAAEPVELLFDDDIGVLFRFLKPLEECRPMVNEIAERLNALLARYF